LESIVYLYPTKHAAESGQKIGGTGFVVGVPSVEFEDAALPYVVTNRHVIEDGKSRTIRANTVDGKTEIFETELDDWTRSTTDDLAILWLPLDPNQHRISLIYDSDFMTKDLLEGYGIGPGDEVCLVSRLVGHDGIQANTPVACFGNIAMMPGDPIRRDDGSTQESFLVDMRSIPGFSGSPALVFIPPADVPFRKVDTAKFPRSAGPWLLGVDWGHISNWRPVYRADRETADTDGRMVKISSGMAGIVPAWKLYDLLYSEEIMKQRKMIDEAYRENAVGSLDHATDEEPEFTQADFEAALKKVSKKLPVLQSDEGKLKT